MGAEEAKEGGEVVQGLEPVDVSSQHQLGVGEGADQKDCKNLRAHDSVSSQAFSNRFADSAAWARRYGCLCPEILPDTYAIRPKACQPASQPIAVGSLPYELHPKCQPDVWSQQGS